MPELPLTGHCLCGAVAYEISEPLENAGYCHCTRCQRRTGTAASAQARIPRGALTITSGEDAIRAYDPGGGGFEKLFCSLCGSALFSRNPQDRGMMSVRLGGLDSDPGVTMEWRQFLNYSAPWEAVPDDGVPRYPESRHA